MTHPDDPVVRPQPTPTGSTGLSETQAGVERTRAWTGLGAVIFGDTAIALAAIVALFHFASGKDASNTAIVSVLTSGFTAIGTMTTAYFGIKAASNTAQTSLTSPQSPPTGGTP